MARLLVAVLDSLCQPGVDLVQCLPLFPRALSNLASVASPSLDAGMSLFLLAFISYCILKLRMSYKIAKLCWCILPTLRHNVFNLKILKLKTPQKED